MMVLLDFTEVGCQTSGGPFSFVQYSSLHLNPQWPSGINPIQWRKQFQCLVAYNGEYYSLDSYLDLHELLLRVHSSTQKLGDRLASHGFWKIVLKDLATNTREQRSWWQVTSFKLTLGGDILIWWRQSWANLYVLAVQQWLLFGLFGHLMFFSQWHKLGQLEWAQQQRSVYNTF